MSLFAFHIIQFNVSVYHRACILAAEMTVLGSIFEIINAIDQLVNA